MCWSRRVVPNLSETCWSRSSRSAISRRATSRIQLGTGILVLPQRDPLLVAKQAATISHLSGGRLALAVGVGYIKEEYALSASRLPESRPSG